jgi:hypothetical protein
MAFPKLRKCGGLFAGLIPGQTFNGISNYQLAITNYQLPVTALQFFQTAVPSGTGTWSPFGAWEK